MLWTDEVVAKMLSLRDAGFLPSEIAVRLGCSASAIYGKMKRVARGGMSHTKPANGSKVRPPTIPRVFGTSPRAATETYKVFLVTNRSTGVTFKVAGVGSELPDVTLKSVMIGEKRQRYVAAIDQTLEYERVM